MSERAPYPNETTTRLLALFHGEARRPDPLMVQAHRCGVVLRVVGAASEYGPAPLPVLIVTAHQKGTGQVLASAVLVDPTPAAVDACRADFKAFLDQQGDMQEAGGATARPGVRRTSALDEAADVLMAALDTSEAMVSWLGDPLAKVDEELAEVRGAETPEDFAGEVGDLLMAAARVAVQRGIDPSSALRGTVARFERRMGFVFACARLEGVEAAQASRDDLERWWRAAKATEKAGSAGKENTP